MYDKSKRINFLLKLPESDSCFPLQTILQKYISSTNPCSVCYNTLPDLVVTVPPLSNTTRCSDVGTELRDSSLTPATTKQQLNYLPYYITAYTDVFFMRCILQRVHGVVYI